MWAPELRQCAPEAGHGQSLSGGVVDTLPSLCYVVTECFPDSPWEDRCFGLPPDADEETGVQRNSVTCAFDWEQGWKMGWCGPAREGAALCILALLPVSVSWHLALSMGRNRLGSGRGSRLRRRQDQLGRAAPSVNPPQSCLSVPRNFPIDKSRCRLRKGYSSTPLIKEVQPIWAQ